MNHYRKPNEAEACNYTLIIAASGTQWVPLDAIVLKSSQMNALFAGQMWRFCGIGNDYLFGSQCNL